MLILRTAFVTLLLLLVAAEASTEFFEVNLYNKDKEGKLCIELNQRTRTKQLTGGMPDLQPVKTNQGIIYWNPKVYAYATAWYSDVLLQVRVLSQLLSYFRDSALSKGEDINGTIPAIAFAQRENLISPELASKYTLQAGNFQMYFNQNRTSFDSLVHPLPWYNSSR